MRSILIHYHEIALKRGNRPLFLRHLAQNLVRGTGDLGPVRVHQLTGRMVLEFDDSVSPEVIQERVGRVFGIANFSHARRIPSTLAAMKAALADRSHQAKRSAI